MGAFIDIVGQRFGRLVTIKRGPGGPGCHVAWWCRCDCGTEKLISGGHLRNGSVKSCGCLRSDLNTTHGMHSTREYQCWADMLSWCRNAKNKWYSYYGGRGIKVCKRWLKFENFFADMGTCPKELSLERRDNDGDYKPSNCYWADRYVQRSNQRPRRPYKKHQANQANQATF